MNIEYDIFNHLKATSLEPYDNDDYVDSITYSEQKQIWNSLKEKDKEIERLNNIIYELEEILEREIKIGEETFPDDNDSIIVCNTLKQVLNDLNKLKELKGSDKD